MEPNAPSGGDFRLVLNEVSPPSYWSRVAALFRRKPKVKTRTVETRTLAWNASAADVETALREAGVEASVSKTEGGYEIDFQGER